MALDLAAELNPPRMEPASAQNNRLLWVTVLVEALVIVAIGAYNIYEIRRRSELVQSKIQGLADYSARQGEKLDHMITAFELYVGKRFATNGPVATNTAATEQRIEKAIEFLETLKGKEKATNQTIP